MAEQKSKSEMVRVKVLAAMSIGGIRIAPDIDQKSGKVKPRTAIIPRERAIAHGPGDCEILGAAPDGSTVGMEAAK